MAKSKVRGGAKVHRKKVESRNQKINNAKTAMQKLFNEAMKAQIEDLKNKSESGDTETIQ